MPCFPQFAQVCFMSCFPQFAHVCFKSCFPQFAHLCFMSCFLQFAHVCFMSCFLQFTYVCFMQLPQFAHVCFMSCFPQFCKGTSCDCSELSLLSGPAYPLNMPEKRIAKRMRQKTEDRVRRALSEYCSSLKFIYHSSFISKKGEGKRLSSHDTRNKYA